METAEHSTCQVRPLYTSKCHPLTTRPLVVNIPLIKKWYYIGVVVIGGGEVYYQARSNGHSQKASAHLWKPPMCHRPATEQQSGDRPEPFSPNGHGGPSTLRLSSRVQGSDAPGEVEKWILSGGACLKLH